MISFFNTGDERYVQKRHGQSGGTYAAHNPVSRPAQTALPAGKNDTQETRGQSDEHDNHFEAY